MRSYEYDASRVATTKNTKVYKSITQKIVYTKNRRLARFSLLAGLYSSPPIQYLCMA